MEEDLMRRTPPRSGSQSGFTMVEMLMVAFILAMGLLGVASMQLVSLKATSGSQNLNTAALVADRVMDEVETEGRLSWINQSASKFQTAGTEPPLFYLKDSSAINVSEWFDVAGTPVESSDPKKIFTANVTGKSVGTDGSATGKLVDVTVQVLFTDVVNGTKTIQRNITLTRRIIYA
jgi:prepilin-type N-terminal cleavage/methylation domain-containing protein